MTLPPDFHVAVDDSVRRIDGGAVLIGGSPLRILRLTPAGQRLVDDLEQGAPVPAGGSAQRLVRRLLDGGMAQPRPGASPFAAADVTVVVPVRNGTVPTGVEHPVVVDDGSDRPIPGAIRHDAPRGPAAARNTGWRQVTTPLVAFVDADCTVPSEWLEGLLPHFADPLVAAVAPRVRSEGGGLLGVYDAGRSPLDLGGAPDRVKVRGRVPYVPSTALVVRRDVLEQLGGFDESMRFGEDVDFVWRLLDAGYTVRYEPGVVVGHPVRPTLGAWLRQRFDYGSSAAPLARRHGRAVAPLAMSGWSFGAWAAALLGWPAVGTAVAAVTTARLAPRLSSLERPWEEAVRIAGQGHAHAGAQVVSAMRRVWWPLVLGGALVSRRVRRAAALAVLPVLTDPLRLLDELAYGAGVWSGCLRDGSLRALRPDLTNWPGRDQAVAIAPAAATISSTHTDGSSVTESMVR